MILGLITTRQYNKKREQEILNNYQNGIEILGYAKSVQ